MGTDSARLYDIPTPVAASTAAYYRHVKDASSTLSLAPIPEAQDLSTIKMDLQSILPELRKRKQQFAKDLSLLDKKTKTGKVHESKTTATEKGGDLDKVQVKQEASDTTGETSELSYASSKSKTQIQRQTAQHAPGKRQPKEEADKEGVGQGDNRSPQHVKQTQAPRAGSPNTEMRVRSATSSNVTSPLLKNRLQLSLANYRERSGTPDTIDFIRVKQKDQVPIATFWTAINHYCSTLTEKDRSFLLEKNDNVKPYLIPPLGRHYADVWAEEERSAVPELSQAQSPSGVSSPSSSRQSSHDHLSSERPKYPSAHSPLPVEPFFNEDVHCGSLTERLLSCLVREQVVDAADFMGQDDDEDGDDDPQDTSDQDEIYKNDGGRTIIDMIPEPTDEVVDFEERLKRELRYAGLFGDDDIAWNAREDDEICAELRQASRELKKQVKINETHKKCLLDVVDRQLQYEQYQHILENLDTQVDQSYQKRYRHQKAKKKKISGALKASWSENAARVMDKRKTWISALGQIFQDKDQSMPTHSVYANLPSSP